MMVISHKDEGVLRSAEVAMQKCESLKHVMILRGQREGFHSYEQEMPLQKPRCGQAHGGCLSAQP